MNVGFFNVFRGDPVHLVLADMMIRSVRESMLGVPIVQFTDETSPAAYGVDEVRRLPNGPRDVIRTDHYIACEGDWVFCDTDIIFQQNVRGVFEFEWTSDRGWDIAICDREGTTVEGEEEGFEFYEKMPYNFGVVFSRSPAFWRAVKEKLLMLTAKQQDWLGIQIAGCQVIAEQSHRFGIRYLQGKIYNYAPRNLKDDCAGAAIVHYKGQVRKKMMLDRFLKTVG